MYAETIGAVALVIAVLAIALMLVSGMFFDESGLGLLIPGAIATGLSVTALLVTRTDDSVFARILNVASVPIGLVGLVVLITGIGAVFSVRSANRYTRAQKTRPAQKADTP